MRDRLGAHRVLMTTSCTAALEIAAILPDLEEGDEVMGRTDIGAHTTDAPGHEKDGDGEGQGFGACGCSLQAFR